MGIGANQKSHDLLWNMAFVCGFIVTVYARFSINNLSSAAKNNPSARVCFIGVKHAHCQDGQVPRHAEVAHALLALSAELAA